MTRFPVRPGQTPPPGALGGPRIEVPQFTGANPLPFGAGWPGPLPMGPPIIRGLPVTPGVQGNPLTFPQPSGFDQGFAPPSGIPQGETLGAPAEYMQFQKFDVGAQPGGGQLLAPQPVSTGVMDQKMVPQPISGITGATQIPSEQWGPKQISTLPVDRQAFQPAVQPAATTRPMVTTTRPPAKQGELLPPEQGPMTTAPPAAQTGAQPQQPSPLELYNQQMLRAAQGSAQNINIPQQIGGLWTVTGGGQQRNVGTTGAGGTNVIGSYPGNIGAAMDFMKSQQEWNRLFPAGGPPTARSAGPVTPQTIQQQQQQQYPYQIPPPGSFYPPAQQPKASDIQLQEAINLINSVGGFSSTGQVAPGWWHGGFGTGPSQVSQQNMEKNYQNAIDYIRQILGPQAAQAWIDAGGFSAASPFGAGGQFLGGGGSAGGLGAGGGQNVLSQLLQDAYNRQIGAEEANRERANALIQLYGQREQQGAGRDTAALQALLGGFGDLQSQVVGGYGQRAANLTGQQQGLQNRLMSAYDAARGNVTGLYRNDRDLLNALYNARTANVMQQLGQERAGIEGGYQERLQRNLGYLEDMGQRARREIQERSAADQARATQGLINRGLFNTTVMDTVGRGIREEEQQRMLDLEEMLNRRRVDIDAALSGDLLGARGQWAGRGLDFLQSLTGQALGTRERGIENYINMLNNMYQQQLGAAERGDVLGLQLGSQLTGDVLGAAQGLGLAGIGAMQGQMNQLIGSQDQRGLDTLGFIERINQGYPRNIDALAMALGQSGYGGGGYGGAPVWGGGYQIPPQLQNMMQNPFYNPLPAQFPGTFTGYTGGTRPQQYPGGPGFIPPGPDSVSLKDKPGGGGPGGGGPGGSPPATTPGTGTGPATPPPPIPSGPIPSEYIQPGGAGGGGTPPGTPGGGPPAGGPGGPTQEEIDEVMMWMNRDAYEAQGIAVSEPTFETIMKVLPLIGGGFGLIGL